MPTETSSTSLTQEQVDDENTWRKMKWSFFHCTPDASHTLMWPCHVSMTFCKYQSPDTWGLWWMGDCNERRCEFRGMCYDCNVVVLM